MAFGTLGSIASVCIRVQQVSFWNQSNFSFLDVFNDYKVFQHNTLATISTYRLRPCFLYHISSLVFMMIMAASTTLCYLSTKQSIRFLARKKFFVLNKVVKSTGFSSQQKGLVIRVRLDTKSYWIISRYICSSLSNGNWIQQNFWTPFRLAAEIIILVRLKVARV